jgi:hypothetical protein
MKVKSREPESDDGDEGIRRKPGPKEWWEQCFAIEASKSVGREIESATRVSQASQRVVQREREGECEWDKSSKACASRRRGVWA